MARSTSRDTSESAYCRHHHTGSQGYAGPSGAFPNGRLSGDEETSTGRPMVLHSRGHIPSICDVKATPSSRGTAELAPATNED